MKEYGKTFLFSIGVICTIIAGRMLLHEDFLDDEENIAGVALILIISLPFVILPIKRFIAKRWPPTE